MNKLLDEHMNSIQTHIDFLQEYCSVVKKNPEKFQNRNLDGNLSMVNITIENLKDRLLEILSYSPGECNNFVQKEIDDHNTTQNDIKEMMPVLLYYYMYKKMANSDQKALSIL